VVSNGQMLVALDNQMIIRDFFYPKVGLENHLMGHYSRMGLYSDRKFSWINDTWNVEMKYLPQTMVSRCSAINKDLGLQLEVNDAVHSFLNVFLRKVVINNIADVT
jgi:glucoamylase